MKIYKKLMDLFYARNDVYAECFYDKRTKRYAYKSVKKKITQELIKKHVTDKKFYGIGIYPLLEGNKTKWISADFDFHSESEKEEATEALNAMHMLADELNINFYTEISKSGNGMHIWLFFSEEIESWKARRLMGGFLLACRADKLSSMDRFFPSQDRLFETSKGFGNLIHMPFSAMFINKGTHFIDEKGYKYKDTSDVEIFLDEIVKLTPEIINTLLDKWDLLNEVESSAVYEQDTIEYTYAPDGLINVLNDPFISWCKNNPSLVDYNAWISLITNLLPFGDEGIKAIHNISSLDSRRYDRKLTQQKILSCEGMKPITYNWIQKNTDFKDDVKVPYKSPAVAGIKTNSVSTPVYESRGRYWIEGAKVDKELSTFTVEPVRVVRIEDQISRVWDLITPDKMIKSVSFDAGDVSSLPAFKRKIMSLYHKLLWYGSENELMRVLDYLNQHYPKLPSVQGCSSVGMIKDPLSKNWIVLTQLMSWDKNSQREDFIYFNPAVKKELTFSPEVSIEKDELKSIFRNLFRFNDISVCATIVGWCISIFVKQRLYESHSVRFPVLMIHGQAGSGKSETARHFIQPFFGDISPMLRVDDITNFAFTALGSSTNMFPLIYDEYKPALFDNSKIKMISKMIRGLYDNESSMRGTKDLSTREFKIYAPAVVIGEMGFDEPALRERSADVFVNKLDAHQYLDNFIKLSKLPISKLGNAILNWTLTLTDEELFQVFKDNIKGNGRVRHNIAMINTGLTLLEKFYDANGIPLKLEAEKEVVMKTQLEAQTILGETRSAVDNILEAMLIMRQSGILEDDVIDTNLETTQLYLHTPTIYPKFKKWARETSFEGEVISHSEFVKQISKMDYYIGYKAVRLQDATRKARVFDIQKLVAKKLYEE